MRKTNTLKILFAFILCVNAGLISAQSQTDEFKPSGNLWGCFFGDFYYKPHSDSLARGGGNVQYRGNQQIDAFQIRRAYLGYDYNFAKNFSASVVLSHEEGPNVTPNTSTNTDAAGYNSMYLKYFYIKWANIFKGSNILIGQMPTPSFATSNNTDPLWSYRSIERTIMDMHNIDGSSDMGVSLQGNILTIKDAKDSLKPLVVGYNLMVANGNSAKPENDRFKKWRANVFASLLQQKLIVGAYADYNTLQLSPYLLTNTTFKGYVNYKTDWFRVGFEAFQQINKNGDIYKTTATAIKDTASAAIFGWSVYGSSRIIKDKLNFFVRMDQYNPDTKFNSNYIYSASYQGGSALVGNGTTTTFYKQTFYSVGLDYTPNGRLHIMPNVWLNQYKTMSDSFAGTNVKGSRAKSDYDLVYRITLYYTFNASKNISGNGMNN